MRVRVGRERRGGRKWKGTIKEEDDSDSEERNEEKKEKRKGRIRRSAGGRR